MSSSIGEVNGWCMAYQRPSSPLHSSSGKSVTQSTSYFSGSSRFSRFATARRSWPSSDEVLSAGPPASSTRSSAVAPLPVMAARREPSLSAFTELVGGSPGRTQMRPPKPICFA